MQMKEKLIQIFETFLERNKEYVVYAYLKNGITGKILINMTLKNRRIEVREYYFRVEWDENNGVYMQNLSLQYEEVMSCYEEVDEYGQQSVNVIFKNGIIGTFECYGEPMEK